MMFAKLQSKYTCHNQIKATNGHRLGRGGQ